MQSFSIVIREFEAQDHPLPLVDEEYESSDDDDDQIINKCTYLKKLENFGKVKTATNFYLQELVTLYKLCAKGFSTLDNQRGRRLTYHPLEGITVILAYYKTNVKFNSFSIDTGYSESKIKRMIDLVRPILLEALKNNWWSSRVPPSDTSPDKIGLIIDAQQ